MSTFDSLDNTFKVSPTRALDVNLKKTRIENNLPTLTINDTEPTILDNIIFVVDTNNDTLNDINTNSNPKT